MRRLAALLTLVALGAAGCTADGPDGVDVADGWDVEVVRTDLDRPTQIALAADGVTLLVAELAGGEDDGLGRVLDLGDLGVATEPVVVRDGLLTPTGLAPATPVNAIVQEQVQVTRQDGSVLAERPYNGRSQGTLSWVPGGAIGRRLLATATGVGSGPDPIAGSGELYVVDLDPDTGEMASTTVAVGFKNAYAHVLGPDGDLWVTEVGDGRYDGEPPADELNRIPAAVWQGALDGTGAPFDGGWPRCTGDADPTEAFGATAEECAALPAPVATFPPRSTPTSVAVTDDGRVLVALWVEGRVVEVDPTTGAVSDVLTGVGNPQHLLALPDGSILLTVHDRGELWRLTPP